jgi:hypothetical protein
MKKYLKERFIDLIEQIDSVEDFLQYILDDVDEWPEVKINNPYFDDDDSIDSEYDEPLSTDTLYITELTDNYLMICAGGDGQDIHNVKLIYNDNYVIAKIRDNGYENSLTDEEFLIELFDIEQQFDSYDDIIEYIKNNHAK